MKNKFISGLSALAIFFGLFSGVLYAQDAENVFPDVSGDHEFAQSIKFMKDNNVFQGYPDGTFQPDRVLNRAEQLKVYMLMHGIDPLASLYKNCFPDVKEDWYARYVCFAKEQGFVEGYPDGTFKPEQEVNKVEALKMLGEIQGWVMPEPDDVDPFSDTPANEWYAKYVSFAKNAGLLTEEGDEFGPAEGLTRAVTAELLFRALAIYALEEDAYSPDLDEQILAIKVADLPTPVPIILPLSPEAEYGDAPESGNAGYAGSFNTVEAKFPTRFNTVNSLYGPGAHALDSSEEWLGDPDLGEMYSYEFDADDPADPDGVMNLDNADAFDDGVRGLNIYLTQIPPPAQLTVDVTVADGAPDVPRYLNVLIDLNMDGKWKGAAAMGEKEWVTVNHVVNVAPGTTETITTDAFAYSHGLLLTPTTWMRVVLSREPIDAAAFFSDGWDGSGVFEHGEVEDYYVQLPNWTNAGGGIGGGPGGPGRGGRGLVWGKPAPVMICPKKVIFPKKVNVVNFSCSVFNFGGKGDNDYNLWRISGGVAVLPVAGTITMPTGPPGFFVPGFPGGVAGVLGNPTKLWFTAVKGNTPSTWGYKIVGKDPESTVEDSVVDLGLVAVDKDEGYEADDDLEDYLSVNTWMSEVDKDYLIDSDFEGIVIYDPVLYEMDPTDSDYDHHIKVAAHAEAFNTGGGALDYNFGSPAGCGLMQSTGQILDWYFGEEDYERCLSGGLEISVNDGEAEAVAEFSELFGVTYEPPPENLPPEAEAIVADWTNEMEDDPHIYNLTVYANDPEDDTLDYEWTGITCGTFAGTTLEQTVQWQYPLDQMEACGQAEVTVEITDSEGNVTAHTQSVF